MFISEQILQNKETDSLLTHLTPFLWYQTMGFEWCFFCYSYVVLDIYIFLDMTVPNYTVHFWSTKIASVKVCFWAIVTKQRQ